MTLVAGADGNSDVGTPEHRRIARLALAEWLKKEPELLLVTYADEIASALADEFASQPPSYVGSVMRGLGIQRPGSSRGQLEEVMRRVAGNKEAADSEVGRRRYPSFVSKPIVALAAALIERGDAATIVNGHNDGDIEEAVKGSPHGPSIELYELHPSNGTSRHQNVLSDSDLFVEREPSTGRRWADLLQEKLSEGRALLIGTDVRSAGLAAALARSRRAGERYALIVAHRQGRDAVPPSATPDERWLTMRTLYYRALAGHYLDMGVAPIFVDFPAQVPQFLREVRLRIEADTQGGKPYKHYAHRYDEWWEAYSPLFGIGGLGSMDRRRQVFQREWYRYLAKLRIDTEGQYKNDGHDEQLLFEVWIRRPHQDRELFLWATSDHIITRTSTSRRASLRIPGGVVQEAFREGLLRAQAVVGHPPWTRSVAFPLTLEDPPHHGLVIGVVRIYSTAERGRIASMLSDPTTLSDENDMRAAIESLCLTVGEPLTRQDPIELDLNILEGNAAFDLGSEILPAG